MEVELLFCKFLCFAQSIYWELFVAFHGVSHSKDENDAKLRTLWFPMRCGQIINTTICPSGLGVWYIFRVDVVPGSNPGWDLLLLVTWDLSLDLLWYFIWERRYKIGLVSILKLEHSSCGMEVWSSNLYVDYCTRDREFNACCCLLQMFQDFFNVYVYQIPDYS